MMKIVNNYNNFNTNTNYSNPNFKANKSEMANRVIAAGRDLDEYLDADKGNPNIVQRGIAKVFGTLLPLSEKLRAKRDINDLVNWGNVAKELVCMVVYPVQVLTNPDLPKDKKRFVGMYDLFVTIFSLGGTLLFAWKGTPLMKKACKNLLNRFDKGIKVPPKLLDNAIEGGAFVTGIALQTILFKRILAPAFAPPLAGAARKKFEQNDAKKANAQGKTLDKKEPENTKEKDSTIIPPEHDAALGKVVSEKKFLK